MKEGIEWRSKWFKEVRAWKPTDIECTRVDKISIFGVPYFMRNKKFLEILLSDIGVCPNLDTILSNPSRLDVMSPMIFTSRLEMIRNKVTICLDGKWIDIIIVEEITISLEDQENGSEVEGSLSISGVFSSSDLDEKEEFVPLVNDRRTIMETEGNKGDNDGTILCTKEVEKVNGEGG